MKTDSMVIQSHDNDTVSHTTLPTQETKEKQKIPSFTQVNHESFRAVMMNWAEEVPVALHSPDASLTRFPLDLLPLLPDDSPLT